MRAILGIIGGLVAGVVAIIGVGFIGVAMTLPVPAGVNPSNTNQVIEVFANAPVAAQLAMMIAWLAGGLVGALVAKLISRTGLVAWIVVALIAAYILANVFILPLPGWMQALWIAAPLIGGFIGSHLVKGGAVVATETVETAQPEA